MSVLSITRRAAGFTLIEMCVVTVVAGIVGALGVSAILQAGRAYSTVNTRSTNYADAQFALRRIEMDLSVITDRSEITEMTSGAITLTRADGTNRYTRSGTQLLLDSGVLANNVTAFNLTYYKSDGSLATVANDIQRIAAEIQVTQSGEAASLRTEVFPRSFRNVAVPTGAPSQDMGKDRRGRRWWWWGWMYRWTRHRIW